MAERGGGKTRTRAEHPGTLCTGDMYRVERRLLIALDGEGRPGLRGLVRILGLEH
jgi:hypothetical protein